MVFVYVVSIILKLEFTSNWCYQVVSLGTNPYVIRAGTFALMIEVDRMSGAMAANPEVIGST